MIPFLGLLREAPLGVVAQFAKLGAQLVHRGLTAIGAHDRERILEASVAPNQDGVA